MPQALMRLFGGMQVKTNMAEFSAECHSMDCSGDSKVNRATDSNKIEVIIKSQEN